MFFTDSQKLIFSIEGSDKKFDPLALDRALRRESNNRLGKLIETWKAVDLDEGDISEQGRLTTALASDEAEEQLALICRKVFDLPDFPDCTDGQALEWLCGYLDWCKKKEMKDTTLPDSSISATDLDQVPKLFCGTMPTM
jgi:hypothetical protein